MDPVRSASVARARSRALCERSRALRAESDSIALTLIGGLRRTSGKPLGEQADDFALRLARLKPVIALVRHDLRYWLERRGVSRDDSDSIVLACSEACANAVEHPRAPRRQAFEVAAHLGPNAIELAVQDFGRWRAARRRRGSATTRGRGLVMIRSLMDEAKVVRGESGTCVTMRRRLDRLVSPSAPRSAEW